MVISLEITIFLFSKTDQVVKCKSKVTMIPIKSHGIKGSVV